MKLLFCSNCGDVFSLRTQHTRQCECGEVLGRYIDDLNVEVMGGPIVLGFNNQSFLDAIRMQLARGDSLETMDYPGGKVTKGRSFEAFIIPESAESVKHIDKVGGNGS